MASKGHNFIGALIRRGHSRKTARKIWSDTQAGMTDSPSGKSEGHQFVGALINHGVPREEAIRRWHESDN